MAGPPPPPPIRAPINKHDHEALTNLSTLPLPQWQHLIPAILHWMEDINWPVFTSCKALLLQHPDAVLEPLRAVWEEWGMVDSQVWIFEGFVRELPMRVQVKLKGTMERWRESEFWAEVRDEWEMEGEVEEWFREVEEWERREGGRSG